jgi:CRISPR-associated protein Cmr2
MAEVTQTFQFTLGPVQGFVAQARRTRDFWAGSFILSWLSSAAIACIEKQGGKVQFPVPDDTYLRHLYGEAGAQDAYPQQGSIPNRFKATMAQVPAGFHPEWVTQAVQDAWLALADSVWAHDLADSAGDRTHAIWQRQTRNFWEMSWVLSPDDGAELLDQRKNWRDLVPPDEPGHKCMMMDGWQELSGVTHTHMPSVRKFWQQLANSGKTGMATDLGEGEQLCALAFIKRRFARYFAEVEVDLPGKLGRIYGWQVPSAVPSVSFVAAAPWLAQVLDRAPVAALQDWNAAASRIASYSEIAHVQDDQPFEIDIRCVKDAAEKRRSEGLHRRWAGLDGQLYFPSALENPRLFSDQKAARQVLQQLQQLRHSAQLATLPSPYYAILLMDGDQLGKHMGEQAKQHPISAALNQFTHKTGEIVRQHNGFLIYAGGDDVLALLPLDDALAAAAALQAEYRAAFQAHCVKEGHDVQSTLSGAIEFVHIRTPLTRVLQDAHRLLDNVAKDDVGRNAIAVRVWKPSGVALQWAMPWEKALDENDQVRISAVAQQFAAQGDNAGDADGGTRFSNKFFFRMQSLLQRFSSADNTTLEALLLAEYLHSWGRLDKHTGLDTDMLKASLNQLLEQCRQWQRPAAGQAAMPHPQHPINPDGALLVRFLAQKGLDEERA